MIIVLCTTEFVLAILIVFTSYMVSYKFKSIEASLEIYSSPRAYKTQSHIAFIEKVVNRYKDCRDNIDKDVDMESIIKTILYKENIGRFSFAAIKNIATKSSGVMWVIILLEGIAAFITKQVHEVPTILIITTSILISIIVEMFKFIKAVEEQGDILIVLVQDYVLNIYPVEVKKNLTNKEIIKLKTRITELEKGLKVEDALESRINEPKQKEKILNSELSIQDIAKLIGIFQ